MTWINYVIFVIDVLIFANIARQTRNIKHRRKLNSLYLKDYYSRCEQLQHHLDAISIASWYENQVRQRNAL